MVHAKVHAKLHVKKLACTIGHGTEVVVIKMYYDIVNIKTNKNGVFSMNETKYFMGMDIGYSSLKVAAGVMGENCKTLSLPAGASPQSAMSKQLVEKQKRYGY